MGSNDNKKNVSMLSLITRSVSECFSFSSIEGERRVKDSKEPSGPEEAMIAAAKHFSSAHKSEYEEKVKADGHRENEIMEIASNKEIMLAESRVRSIVENAKCILKIAKAHGSFSGYMWGSQRQQEAEPSGLAQMATKGAKKEWGLSPKAKVRVLHTAQLDVTSTNVPNVLLTHPTLYLDSHFSSSNDSHGSDLEVSFPSRTRNMIFDPRIFIEVQSERPLSREEFSISFIHDPLYPVFDSLLPFSSKNENTVFKPGILSYLLVPLLDEITFDFSENPMMMYGGDIPLLDVPYLHLYPPRPSSSMWDLVRLKTR
uniref:DNA glycosylase superfamily protein n=1 Tax=Tanacetum cinerariifolium TaxID=118510 RepID=A0A6L2M9N8_TANCI|nr:DNA glycosylase superfamily protein [Tanacetum cinerariifolium]